MFEAGFFFSSRVYFALPLFFSAKWLGSDANYFPFQGCDGKRLRSAKIPVPGEAVNRARTLVLLQTGQHGAVFLLQKHSRYLARVFRIFQLKAYHNCFCTVSTADSQSRKRDIEGLCDNPTPSPSPQRLTVCQTDACIRPEDHQGLLSTFGFV